MKLVAFALAVGAVTAIAIPQSSVATTLYAVTSSSASGAQLLTVDPASAAVLTSTPIVLNTGDAVRSANGLAIDPTTQVLFVVLQRAGSSPAQRVLAMLAPNGAATLVGELGDAFAGLAFGADGTLYGVTGDGASTPEHLFTIDKTTAAATSLMPLGNGTDGEAIAFHPGDGLLYHMSGYADEVYEKVDPLAMTVENIPLSGDAYLEATALVYSPPGGFLMCDLNAVLYHVSESGAVTAIGNLPVNTVVKGLAFGPEPVPVVRTSWGALKAGYR